MGNVSEQRIYGLEPERCLDDVTGEELRNQAADVRDLLEAIEYFFRYLLVESHRRRRAARKLGQACNPSSALSIDRRRELEPRLDHALTKAPNGCLTDPGAG